MLTHMYAQERAPYYTAPTDTFVVCGNAEESLFGRGAGNHHTTLPMASAQL